MFSDVTIGGSEKTMRAMCCQRIDKNVNRRHLDESQRAMVAGRIADMRQGERTDLAPNGAKSQSHAAARLNVSRRNVQRAHKVIDLRQMAELKLKLKLPTFLTWGQSACRKNDTLKKGWWR
jgi:hypothetical protein